MYSGKMVDALATVFRRFKPGSRANTETLIFLSIYELSTRNELITTHKIKKHINKSMKQFSLLDRGNYTCETCIRLRSEGGKYICGVFFFVVRSDLLGVVVLTFWQNNCILFY